MKSSILIFLALLGLCYAQIPQGISFQGIARDAQGNCLTDSSINIDISILNSATGTTGVYTEGHDNTQTDAQGVYALTIGQGSPQFGTFSDIDWSTPKWVKLDINGAGVATVELMSVPFAFQADRAYKSDSAIIAIRADSSNWADSTIFALNGKLVNGVGTETLVFRRSNGSLVASISDGVFVLNDPVGNERIRLVSEPTQSGVGFVRLRGAGNPGSVNVQMGAKSPALTDNGAIAVFDAASNAKAEMCVDASGNGFITAAGASGGIKAFTMPHPQQPNKNIVYASLEGPEAAAYDRGTATLVNGEATITFSDHYALVANHQTMTVTLTPLSADSKGMAVIEKTETGFKVKELMGGKGNYSFDWRVEAVRKGHENFEVIRDKRE